VSYRVKLIWRLGGLLVFTSISAHEISRASYFAYEMSPGFGRHSSFYYSMIRSALA
jgi:hypothetical protein